MEKSMMMCEIGGSVEMSVKGRKIGGSIESSVMEGNTGATLKEVSDGMVKQGAI